MKNSLSAEELHSRLEEIDAGLEAQALPLKYRPLECFKAVYGDVRDGPLRNKLFERLLNWYKGRYGNRAEPDGIIGRVPVLLRGQVYLALVPLTEGDTLVRLVDRIEGLPVEVSSTLSREEFEAVARKIAGATLSFQRLYSLTVEDGFLDGFERGLIWRGLFDLETAATTLRHVGDTQNTIFQIHQAAEKFLKVALKRAGSVADLKRLGHNLPALFAELIGLSDRYTWLRPSVDALQALAPSMEIRYSVVPRRREDAIEAFHAALSICGALAQMWLFDMKRGSNRSGFSPGSYYLDGNNNTYLCRSTHENAGLPSAVLTRFMVSPILGRVMIDMSVDVSASALYLEVHTEEELLVLRREFEALIRTPPRRSTPEEIEIKIDSGPAGSYTTALFRLSQDES